MFFGSRSSYLLETWEETELKIILRERSLDYWKLYDVTNKRYLYVDTWATPQLKDTKKIARFPDEMYWTKSGDDLIENRATGVSKIKLDLI